MKVLYGVLEQHGIGVAVAVAAIAACWFLLRYIIQSHKEDREVWQQALASQQKLAMNHLTHLNSASESMCAMLQHHDENSKRNSDDIVHAIEAQTTLLRSLYEKA